jgi:aminopeptidase C
MKRIFLLVGLFCSLLPLSAQDKSEPAGFQFTTLKEIPITPIKNQSSSSTCWSFSGLGFIEAELLRQGKGTHDLSAMFVVHKNYEEKARKYVRMNGKINFAAGGSFADVFDCIRDYGIVPTALQPGLNYGDSIHRHGEMDRLLKAYITALVASSGKKLSTAWMEGFLGITNAYLGLCPASVTYNGKNYTPQSYAQSLGIRPEEYISLTSFTHHPFYKAFPLEIPDNWRWADSYNLPLEEMMQVIDYSLDNGYTVAWATDVSEKGFNRKGIAIMPDLEAAEGPGSDQEHWLGLSPSERESQLTNLSSPLPEKRITQAMRQEAFDNYETTDDHGMLLFGTAQDQNGTKYYLVKNSWGVASPYKGIWYASVPFVQYKTLTIVVHKDALPREIRSKLGL